MRGLVGRSSSGSDKQPPQKRGRGYNVTALEWRRGDHGSARERGCNTGALRRHYEGSVCCSMLVIFLVMRVEVYESYFFAGQVRKQFPTSFLNYKRCGIKFRTVWENFIGSPKSPACRSATGLVLSSDVRQTCFSNSPRERRVVRSSRLNGFLGVTPANFGQMGQIKIC